MVVQLERFGTAVLQRPVSVAITGAGLERQAAIVPTIRFWPPRSAWTTKRAGTVTIGVVTGLFGAPLFLWLLRRQ